MYREADGCSFVDRSESSAGSSWRVASIVESVTTILEASSASTSIGVDFHIIKCRWSQATRRTCVVDRSGAGASLLDVDVELFSISLSIVLAASLKVSGPDHHLPSCH